MLVLQPDPRKSQGPAVFVVDAHFLPGLNRLTSHDQHNPVNQKSRGDMLPIVRSQILS